LFCFCNFFLDKQFINKITMILLQIDDEDRLHGILTYFFRELLLKFPSNAICYSSYKSLMRHLENISQFLPPVKADIAEEVEVVPDPEEALVEKLFRVRDFLSSFVF
jgi:hypothetical protein